MNEKESLAIIKDMITRSKSNFKNQAFYYLIWGWLVVGALLVESFLFNLGNNLHWLVWPVMGVTGAISTSLYGRKNKLEKKHISHIDHIMKFVWGGVVMYIFIIIICSSKFGWINGFILMSGLYGLGTFISGGILKFKPLIYGGLSSFALVIIAIALPTIFNSFNDAMGLLALSIIVSYLIPGYMLKHS